MLALSGPNILYIGAHLLALALIKIIFYHLIYVLQELSPMYELYTQNRICSLIIYLIISHFVMNGGPHEWKVIMLLSCKLFTLELYLLLRMNRNMISISQTMPKSNLYNSWLGQ